MKLLKAIGWCHVRSGIYRKEKPDEIYWKNNPIDIIDRVPEDDKDKNDWEEFDPRNQYDCSVYG